MAQFDKNISLFLIWHNWVLIIKFPAILICNSEIFFNVVKICIWDLLSRARFRSMQKWQRRDDMQTSLKDYRLQRECFPFMPVNCAGKDSWSWFENSHCLVSFMKISGFDSLHLPRKFYRWSLWIMLLKVKSVFHSHLSSYCNAEWKVMKYTVNS